MASKAWSRLPLFLVALCLPATAYALPTYKEPPVDAYPKSTSTIQRVYDEITQRASTMAGAPNAPSRGTNAPRLRVAPNFVDSTTQKTLSALDDIGGARQAYDTEKKGLPRRSYRTVNEILDQKTAPSTPQILDEPKRILPTPPQIIEGKKQQPIQLKTTPQKPILQTLPKSEQPLIKGSALSSTPTQPPIIKSTPQKQYPDFMFRSINQGETLTTPMLGSPSSK